MLGPKYYEIVVIVVSSLVVVAIFYFSLTASSELVAAQLAALGQLLSACGVLAAVAALLLQRKQQRAEHQWRTRQEASELEQQRAEYDWRVRRFTLELAQSWNQHTRRHLDALSREFPVFFRGPKSGQVPWCLPRARAKELVFCEGELPSNTRPLKDIERDRALRNHLISLLNYFETMAQAHEQKIADEQAIEDSFSSMMIDTYTYFDTFVQEMREVTTREPWPPLNRTIALWRAQELRKRAAEEVATSRNGAPNKPPIIP